ncbi:site-specific integrase [Parabacteroides pacaensis]|uniref:site-specific integrase n=1 Tax=Parabacteroides pacaensis TaxID=2086575 RepID=UPI000D110DD2|nr:site-specific integrase [Parabacteroides pacaensis]
MEKVIYNLVFNRKKQLNTEGEALIQVEAYFNKRKKYFSTKVYVKPNQWDNKRKFIRNHPNMDALNRKIRAFIAELERIELEAWQSGKEFDLNHLKRKEEIASKESFISFFKKETENGTLKDSTRKNHLSTLKLLIFYNKDISFDDITYDFLCSFEHHLLSKGYHKNTIAKHLKHIKRYINLAINKDLFSLQKYPFRKFKIKYSESHREHLTPDELKKIEKVDLSNYHPRYQKSLDAFLFSCYTGLRYSDIIRLTTENILYINSKTWLIYSTQKTETEIRLPLFLLFDGKAIPIIKKYMKDNIQLFGLPDNSNVNKQLAKICKLARVNKKVSFHTARHTNATLLLYNGANITTVQKLLGHKSVRTTQIYSNIMDMTIIKDLEKMKKTHR